MPPAHSSPRSAGLGDEVTAEMAEERGRDRPSGQAHTHSLRRNGTTHHPRTGNPDPSCLLTPPNTPLYPDGGGGGGGGGCIVGTNTQPNGCISRTVAESKKTNGIITNGLEGRLNQIHEVDRISAAHEQTSGRLHNKYRHRDMDISLCLCQSRGTGPPVVAGSERTKWIFNSL